MCLRKRWHQEKAKIEHMTRMELFKQASAY